MVWLKRVVVGWREFDKERVIFMVENCLTKWTHDTTDVIRFYLLDKRMPYGERRVSEQTNRRTS